MEQKMEATIQEGLKAYELIDVHDSEARAQDSGLKA